jgi:dihydroorotase
MDIIATDHAPHLIEDKKQSYFKVPAGLPLVQHALLTLFELVRDGQISLELLVDKTSHAVADIYGVIDRGYVREGYFADLVLIDNKAPYTVNSSNMLSKCHWSPFEGETFSSTVDTTIVNGHIIYQNGKLHGDVVGQRLQFKRGR